MFYTVAAQVAAILPSATPPVMAHLVRVSYQGQSGSIEITAERQLLKLRSASCSSL